MNSITKSSNHQTSSIRLSDIRKLISGRYGGPCNTADAERYLTAAIPELMPRARSWRYAVSWAREWTPILLEEHGEDFIRDCWTKVTTQKRPNLTTDQLARLLAVADDEPARLNLRCIPAASRTAEIRAADRKAKRRLADTARHAAAGHTPRSQSLQAKEPWKAAGVSRSAWFANRRAERLASMIEPEIPVLDSFAATVSVSPSWTDLRPPDPLTSLQATSGQEEPQGLVSANDDIPPPATVAGYRGRNVTFTAAWVDILVSAAPHIADDLAANLDAVDALMVKTPERNHRAVSLNLCRDLSRRIMRSRRNASSALAA